MVALHPDWLVPDWPAPVRVRSVFTTRAGGVSSGPYASLNLGRPSSDEVVAVDTNRRRLQQAIGAAPVFMSQVHGVETVELTGAALPQPLVADACVSAVPGQVCAVRVADCLPVLLTNAQGSVVGAAHAGWRGLAQGVIERNFEALKQVGERRGRPVTSAQTMAWLGPCIGPKAFEVGDEVREAFVAVDAAAAGCFKPCSEGKWLADLPALARLRLNALGVTRIFGNDGAPQWCTVGNPSRFFSHRRDSRAFGGSGRMAACIWIDDSDGIA